MNDDDMRNQTYADGVLDTVLFVMEELASGVTNEVMIKRLKDIHDSLIDERVSFFRTKYNRGE